METFKHAEVDRIVFGTPCAYQEASSVIIILLFLFLPPSFSLKDVKARPTHHRHSVPLLLKPLGLGKGPALLRHRGPVRYSRAHVRSPRTCKCDLT